MVHLALLAHLVPQEEKAKKVSLVRRERLAHQAAFLRVLVESRARRETGEKRGTEV